MGRGSGVVWLRWVGRRIPLTVLWLRRVIMLLRGAAIGSLALLSTAVILSAGHGDFIAAMRRWRT
jgi:hypothetical protein